MDGTEWQIESFSHNSLCPRFGPKVGGDHIDTLTLIKGDLDPHSYQLVKGDDEKLGFAKSHFL